MARQLSRQTQKQVHSQRSMSRPSVHADEIDRHGRVHWHQNIRVHVCKQSSCRDASPAVVPLSLGVKCSVLSCSVMLCQGLSSMHVCVFLAAMSIPRPR